VVGPVGRDAIGACGGARRVAKSRIGITRLGFVTNSSIRLQAHLANRFPGAACQFGAGTAAIGLPPNRCRHTASTSSSGAHFWVDGVVSEACDRRGKKVLESAVCVVHPDLDRIVVYV